MKRLRCPINRMAMSSQRQRPAFITPSGAVSYRALECAVALAARFLRAAGIRKGRCVALWGERSAECLTAYFALLRVGARPCLINTRKPAAAFRDTLSELKVSYILVPRGHRRRYPGITVLPYSAQFSNETTKATVRSVTYAYNGIADIMQTSGSSGHAKAVVHSVANHIFSAAGSNRHIPLCSTDAWVVSLPFYHVSGLSIIWRCFVAGAAAVLPGTGTRLPDMLRPEVTHLSCVPVQLTDLLSCDRLRTRLPRLKAVLLGGSAIPPGLVRRACRANVPVYATYGLTEMSSQVATTPQQRRVDGLAAAEVLPYRRVKIDSRQQIWVAGRTLCRGFWKGGRIKAAGNSGGWYATGDRGRWTANGGLEVLGRTDRMFVSGGENVYPEEVEKALMSMPEITETVVFPRPSLRFGQRPVAVIRFEAGRSVRAEILRRRLAQVLEKFKVPDEFYVWPEGGREGRIKTDRARIVRAVSREGRLLG